MKVFVYTLIMFFVSQTTIGLLAHCSSPIQIETQTKTSHHSMSQMTDMQLEEIESDSQHDCCDEDNAESSFPDNCDCEAGLVFTLVSEPNSSMNHVADSYLSIRPLPKLEPTSAKLLRPPILI